MSANSDISDLTAKLSFPNSTDVMRYCERGATAEQSLLMEFQRHLIWTATIFINSKYRSGLRYDWKYLGRLAEQIAGPDRASFIVESSSVQAASHNIANCYSLLSAHLSVVKSNTNALSIDKYQSLGEDDFSAALGDVAGIFNRLDDELLGAYVHGSGGSGDYNAYSDIDLLAIFSSRACTDPEALKDIRIAVGEVCRRIYCYDPLQHHGVFALCELDLIYYPEAYLPLAVFHNSKALSGVRQLDVNVRDSRYEALRGFAIASAQLRASMQSRNALNNLDRIKRFNSNLLLLPALYLATKGIFAYKRDTFALLEEHIGEHSRYAIDVASDVRSKWVNSGFNFSFERSFLGANLFSQRLVRAAFSRSIDRFYAGSLRSLYDEKFWRSIHSLLDEMDETYG